MIIIKNFSPKANNAPSTPQPPSQLGESNNWTHCRLDWLKPENVRDAEKRKPDHPDYDPRTLYVPKEFKASQTPVRLFFNKLIKLAWF